MFQSAGKEEEVELMCESDGEQDDFKEREKKKAWNKKHLLFGRLSQKKKYDNDILDAIEDKTHVYMWNGNAIDIDRLSVHDQEIAAAILLDKTLNNAICQNAMSYGPL
jgi:hypothetical protein